MSAKITEINDVSRRLVFTSASASTAIQTSGLTSHKADVTWEQVQQLLEQDATVMVKVYDYNKGGLLAQYDNYKGFMPFSQCAEDMNQEDVKSMVGQKMSAKITEINDVSRRLVFTSASAPTGIQTSGLTSYEADVTWEQVQQLVEQDATIMVKVYDYNKGGLLAKYGDYKGFMPFSQCAENLKLEDFESILGQELPAKIARIDDHNNRLVFRSATAHVGMQTFDITSLKVGDVVEGTVSSIKPFGAFIDIGGFNALLHISQISDDLIQDFERNWKNLEGEVMAVGDKLKVAIYGCDVEHGRVMLSTKKLHGKPPLLADSLHSPQVGDKFMGLICEVDDDGAYVQIGQSGLGCVPLFRSAFLEQGMPLESLSVGMTREFVVVERNDDMDETVLSLATMEDVAFWQRISELQQENTTVTVQVYGFNRGGLQVTYGPYIGFMPLSAIGQGVVSNNTEAMQALVGQELPAKLLEVQKGRKQLVFSHKKVASLKAAASLQVGHVVEGTVKSIKPYGAIIDLGALTALLHISRVSHDHIKDMEKIFTVGDKIKAMIYDNDQQGAVSLSTKHLEYSPGDMIHHPQVVFDRAEEMADKYRNSVSPELRELYRHDSRR